jgi:hypothetical protein
VYIHYTSSGESDVCDVTLSVYQHRASLKNIPWKICLEKYFHRGQAYFQACPVWIYTQGNITVSTGLIYYFTVPNLFTDNYNLFKTSKHSLQTNSKIFPDCWEKRCRDILLNPFYLYPIFFRHVMFSLCCMVFWPLYCVFETCKVKRVIKTLFRLTII